MVETMKKWCCLAVMLPVIAGNSLASGKRVQRDSVIMESVVLEQIDICDFSLATLIRRTMSNLPQKHYDLPSFLYGNGQLTQIVRRNGIPIQLSRQYGWYVTPDCAFRSKELNAMLTMGIEFFPVYNARSLAYEKPGVLLSDFSTAHNYTFQYLYLLTHYMPLFCPSKDYEYHILDQNGYLYTISFVSSKRYPKKNPLYATGTMVIDAENMRLVSMTIDRMECVLAWDWESSRLVKQSAELQRYIDKVQHTKESAYLHFADNGQVDECMLDIEWDNKKRYADHPLLIRPFEKDSILSVTEFWKAESCSMMKFKDYYSIIGFEFDPFSPHAGYQNFVAAWYAPLKSVYDKEKIDNVDWYGDYSVVEKEISNYRPIEEQYELMSDYDCKRQQERDSMLENSLNFKYVPIAMSEEMYSNIRQSMFVEP